MDDIPVPVSYKEYRKIERFRKGLKCNKKYPLPKRLFFCESEPELIWNAFQNENNTYDISFKAYDAELLEEIENMLNEISEKVKELYNHNAKRSEYDDLFIAKYKEMKDSENAIVLWYLDQVGIRSESDFMHFLWLELPIIKQELRKED